MEETDTASIRWVNDCSIFLKIHKKHGRRKAIGMEILSTSGNIYL
jgi:hypothetical protein